MIEETEERRLRTSNKEREALIAQEKEQQGLSPASLAVVLGMLFIALILFTPKIYLTNNIYYTSRVIQKLSSQKELLQEEKHRLELELEKQRYKYNIENMP
ncbi:hypothetical protein [Helicobacter suis]|uniref:Septum formation initiator n=2 Tax=Helicobacter suis TaxID=104628 RepID=E7G581_9HELI|nr:hypothetical protein [Helicobacter suis]EFX41446.1 hypothetical protein HSUHS5_1164 [Helicobacter suis HS5]EFX42688.1 hypothetical protein HSUHS1_1080 [Helicobacter suis HS1]BCD45847.1 hypothetical protein NHP190020_08860 [Helicobacter suis]BCD48225.1 hypothetical protein NHP194003_14290 [Helicobacter suis]BCD49985.1 hypothetical protein NHP194004_14320 [Helicobacter suis]